MGIWGRDMQLHLCGCEKDCWVRTTMWPLGVIHFPGSTSSLGKEDAGNRSGPERKRREKESRGAGGVL